MALPDRVKRGLARWAILFVGWSVLGALQGLTDASLMANPAQSWRMVLVYYPPLAWAWAAVTPLIGAWSAGIRRAYPKSLASRVAAHLPFLLLVAAADTWLRRVLITASEGPLRVGFDVTLLYFADMTIASYLVAVLVSRAFEASATLAAREQQAVALRQQLVNAQMEYLELQLRPHFLFNALSTIAELAHEAPQSAARMLTNVGALLESAVTREGRRLVPLGEELDALQPYLDIQRLRFTDWLVIEEDVAEEARRALVPRFILQPLVENAVHHGLINRSARGHIGIRARVAGGRLSVAVVDNGVGLHGASAYREGRGLGLANLRARLDAVYGGHAVLELRDEGGMPPSVGTAARLELPLTNQRPESPAPSDDEPDAVASPFASTSAIPRWVSAHPALTIVAAWSVVCLLRVQHSYSYMLLRGRLTAASMQSAVRFDVAVAGLWLLMTPLVLRMARRVPLRREDRPSFRGAFAHVAAGVGVSYTHGVLARLVGGGTGSLAIPTEMFAWNLFVYSAIVVVVQAHDLERWIRDREQDSERLRRELREARFRRVMLELRPAVLLETLRHLQTLVVQSPARAERVLADIGDFLRATLKNIHEPAVTLREEGETVRAYARVLGAASVPELTLHMSLAVPLLDDPVPNGVLRFALDEVLDDRGTDRRAAVIHLDALTHGDQRMTIRATAASGSAPPSSWSATVTGSPPELAQTAA
jgi:hypothetical protein